MNFRTQAALLIVLVCSATLSAHASVNVFACEPEWKALAEALGGDRVQAVTATNAFQDPHHIEARPSLILKARDADLLFCTGAELEVGWLPLLLEKSGNRRIQPGQLGHFLATAQVELIEVPGSVDRSHGDVHADGNPHVHLDPNRLLTIAQAFSNRLQTIDAESAAFYSQRFVQFSTAWLESIDSWNAKAEGLKGKRAIVYHKNWSYLLDWLQIDIAGDLEPKPGIPPTSSHLALLLQSAQQQASDFILIANYQDTKGARWLAEKSGIGMLEMPFTVGGSVSAVDLPSLYESIIDILLNGN